MALEEEEAVVVNMEKIEKNQQLQKFGRNDSLEMESRIFSTSHTRASKVRITSYYYVNIIMCTLIKD